MNSEGCDIPRNEDLSVSIIIFLLFSTLESILGVSVNAFILVVTGIQGIRERRLKTLDKIMTALSISKICFLCIFAVKTLWSALSTWAFEMTEIYKVLRAAIWFLTCTNLWFSACLCAFYCAKIATFQNYIFIYLKTRISRMVPWLLLVSVLVSLVNTTPFYSGIYDITCKNNYSSGSLGNLTSEKMTVETNLFDLFLYCGIGFSLAFFILTLSTFFLLFSLWRHTHRMQNRSANFSNPSLDAHFKAVKTIISLLIIDGINFTALMLLLSNIFSESGFAKQLCTFIVNSCPGIETNILIWGNPRLKGAFIEVLHYIKRPSMF